MADVFISYSRKDIDFAQRLFDSLQQHGRESWIDLKNIPLSAGWWEEIKNGIDSATAFVFVMTPDSLVSPVCTLELSHAIARHKRIIPMNRREVNIREAYGVIAAVKLTDYLAEMAGEVDLLLMARANWRVLEGTNRIDFREMDDYDTGLTQLLTALETDLDEERLHARLLVKAREWESHQRGEGYLLFGGALREAEQWLKNEGEKERKATDDHRAFIQASLDKEAGDNAEQQRQITELNRASERAKQSSRIAALAGVAAVLLVAALGAAAFIAWRQINDANAGIATAMVAQQRALDEQGTALNQVATATIAQGNALNSQGTAVAQLATATVAQGAALNDQATANAVLLEAEVKRDILNTYSSVLLNIDINPSSQLARMTDLVAQYPDRADVFNYRGLVYDTQQRYDEAIADYTRAIELDPEFALAYNSRGNVYTAIEEYDLALADYARAIELDPEYALAFNNRGNAYAGLGDYEQALADYNRVIELDPEYVLAYFNLGLIHTNLRDYDQAFEDYNRALELDPDYVLAYLGRGNVYAKLRDFDQALEDYNRAIELDPSRALGYQNRGNLYLVRGDYELAIVDYNRLIALNPGNGPAYVNRAVAYSRMNQLLEAAADRATATALAP